MDRYDIQMLRDLPIEGVAERLGMQVARHKALCPFHDDRHPSLSFHTGRNTFKCFVCGTHGGTIDIAMKVLGKSFADTCRWLADEHNIIVAEHRTAETRQPARVTFAPKKYERFFEHPFISNVASEFLIGKRRIDPRIIRWCRLNSWKEWLQIPYYDTRWQLMGIQWRYMGTDSSQPRFRFPYGSQCHIYNLPVLQLLQPHEPLYITEGCSDCWAMLSAGHKAIAIPSATLLKPGDLSILSSLHDRLATTFHMYPDADEPGERLFSQLLTLSIQIGVPLTRHQLPHDCKDFSEYYANQHLS